MNFYDFSAFKMNGETVSMSDFKGKVVIVVNTASKCGFTPQFEGLEKLYENYKDQGLEILGFPVINLLIKTLAKIRRSMNFVS